MIPSQKTRIRAQGAARLRSPKAGPVGGVGLLSEMFLIAMNMIVTARLSTGKVCVQIVLPDSGYDGTPDREDSRNGQHVTNRPPMQRVK